MEQPAYPHTHLPPQSHHDNHTQLLVIIPFLPVSEVDYILAAENQVTNEHGEQPQQLRGMMEKRDGVLTHAR